MNGLENEDDNQAKKKRKTEVTRNRPPPRGRQVQLQRHHNSLRYNSSNNPSGINPGDHLRGIINPCIHLQEKAIRTRLHEATRTLHRRIMACHPMGIRPCHHTCRPILPISIIPCILLIHILSTRILHI